MCYVDDIWRPPSQSESNIIGVNSLGLGDLHISIENIDYEIQKKANQLNKYRCGPKNDQNVYVKHDR